MSQELVMFSPTVASQGKGKRGKGKVYDAPIACFASQDSAIKTLKCKKFGAHWTRLNTISNVRSQKESLAL